MPVASLPRDRRQDYFRPGMSWCDRCGELEYRDALTRTGFCPDCARTLRSYLAHVARAKAAYIRRLLNVPSVGMPPVAMAGRRRIRSDR
jgi:hypothetical protein